MLMRERKRQEGAYWQPIAYIASEKRILRRLLRETGCRPDADGAAHLDAMPETFREFINLEKAHEKD